MYQFPYFTFEYKMDFYYILLNLLLVIIYILLLYFSVERILTQKVKVTILELTK